MRRLLLIRAYGDFVIAIRSALLSHSDINIVASNHLFALFEAISEVVDTSALNISFEDFDIKGDQLHIFTNRYLFQQDTLDQIKAIKNFFKNEENNNSYIDIVEHKRRKHWLQIVTGKKFQSIVQEDQVYQEYAKFFQHNNTDIVSSQLKEKTKILVLPDARIEKRNLPQEIVQSIIEDVNNRDQDIQVAYFKRVSQLHKKVRISTDLIFKQTVYHNFKELFAVIQQADFIIGADSLPIHICQFLNKPHFILYPNNGSKAFFTPYTLKRNYYCEFGKYNNTTIPY